MAAIQVVSYTLNVNLKLLVKRLHMLYLRYECEAKKESGSSKDGQAIQGDIDITMTPQSKLCHYKHCDDHCVYVYDSVEFLRVIQSFYFHFTSGESHENGSQL